MAEKDKISSQMCNVLQGRIDSNDNLIKDIEERQEKKNKENKDERVREKIVEMGEKHRRNHIY